MDQFIIVLELGLIYGIMALGVYITYTILDFPDLSVDGTFPLGIAICTVMLRAGNNPWLALILAMLAGALAGTVTGLLHVKLKIRNLLCGILVMTALYSVNYNIVGKASETLNINVNTIFSMTSGVFGKYNKLTDIFIIAVAAKLVLDLYLKTKSGFLLRSAGDNEGLVVTLGKNPGTVKIIGLAISNALVALSGALYCQYIRSFNVGAGTGTVVMGLAAVIIGTTVFKKIRFLHITTGVIIGMILYKACIQVALVIGIPSADNNLIITLLFVITLVLNEFALNKKKTHPSEVRKDA